MTALTPIRRLLIANRGEIAVRVARTARTLGIETVAIYTEPDRGALHTIVADEAVELTGGEPRALHLDVEGLVRVAKEHGCDAVHPGYGFLSENAAFARACADAGIRFVGPAPETIEAMGGKIEARRRMDAAGVPVIPGAHPSDDDDMAALAAGLGFPLLVKASAGGGGRGMRRVDDPTGLDEALAAARREAAGSFGDATVYLEKLIDPARHVEVQIVGDTHGCVRHFGERDCSVQRRYQKVIEEAPAPDLPDDLRAAIHAAAVKAGEAVGYVGAGTVELVVSADGGFYFLEMNTRLQVEHPITEMVWGVDLVALQLHVAAGGSIADVEAAPRGSAIECRIYAEDPSKGFMPSPGPLLVFETPRAPGVRVDSGVRSGDILSAAFDPMIAKIAVWGPDRATALEKTLRALEHTVVLGMASNVSYLLDVLESDPVRAGAVDTGYLARFEPSEPAAPSELVAAVATAVALRRPGTHGSAAISTSTPWEPGRVGPLGPGGFR